MTKKEIALQFLHLAATGEAGNAFELFVGKNFKHHNAYFKGDGNSLMKAMDDNAVQNPNKIFEVQRVLEEDDLVAVHSKIVLAKAGTELAVIHIFRFEQSRIAELWDFGQAVPVEVVNEHGMF